MRASPTRSVLPVVSLRIPVKAGSDSGVSGHPESNSDSERYYFKRRWSVSNNQDVSKGFLLDNIIVSSPWSDLAKSASACPKFEHAEC